VIENRARENLHEVRIADEHRQRRVLDDVQELRRERRGDKSHRLRDDHEPHRQAAMQAERAGRLALASGDRQDAGANNLRDERCGEGHQSKHERDHFGNDLKAAVKIEAGEPRDIEREWRPGRRRHEWRQSDDEGCGDERGRRLRAR
jgi:hypothetical protein